ncbi:hypothetical protein ABIE41_003438 [Bosea sp. OAE506]
MPQQSEAEGGGSRRIRLQRPRRQGRDLPAGRSRARLRRHGGAQQKCRRARAFRRQGQAPARGQVEAPRLAPGFDQHRPQRRAAGGLGAGAQHALGIARPHQQDAGRIEPEFGQPRRVQPAGLGIDDILPHPEDRAPGGGPDGEADGESSRRREIGRGGRIDLVQGRPGDAATQRRIKGGRAETHLPHRRRRAAQRHLGEMAAQIGQGSGVRAGLHEGSCSIFVLL